MNGDTLCFYGLDGQEISDLMEATGADYNYSYESPEAAWNIEEIVGEEVSRLDTSISKAKEKQQSSADLKKETENENER